jgi:hypothetical protein
MDALMRMMRQTHHDAINTSMFDAKAYPEVAPRKKGYFRRH